MINMNSLLFQTFTTKPLFHCFNSNINTNIGYSVFLNFLIKNVKTGIAKKKRTKNKLKNQLNVNTKQNFCSNNLFDCYKAKKKEKFGINLEPKKKMKKKQTFSQLCSLKKIHQQIVFIQQINDIT